jgi:NADPH:quinone reductase-like Zn-dependent oxidoreductase
VVINYAEEDFVDAVAAATEGHGADVILDVVGGKYLQRNVTALADGGRLVIIGLLGGTTGELDIAALMGRRAGVIGTQLRSRPVTGPGSKGEVVQAVRDNLWPLIAAKAVCPTIGLTVPMDRAGEAHRALRDGAVTGKAVLVVPS